MICGTLLGIPWAKTADFLLFHVKQQGALAEFAANYHRFAGIPPSILPKGLWTVSCFTKALYSPRKHRAPSIPLLLAKEAPNDGPAPPQNTKGFLSLPRAAAFFFLFARKCPPSRSPQAQPSYPRKRKYV